RQAEGPLGIRLALDAPARAARNGGARCLTEPSTSLASTCGFAFRSAGTARVPHWRCFPGLATMRAGRRTGMSEKLSERLERIVHAPGIANHPAYTDAIREAAELARRVEDAAVVEINSDADDVRLIAE